MRRAAAIALLFVSCRRDAPIVADPETRDAPSDFMYARSRTGAPPPERALDVWITRSEVYLDAGQPLSPGRLESALRAMDHARTILVHADLAVTFRALAETISAAKRAGFLAQSLAVTDAGGALRALPIHIPRDVGEHPIVVVRKGSIELVRGPSCPELRDAAALSSCLKSEPSRAAIGVVADDAVNVAAVVSVLDAVRIAPDGTKLFAHVSIGLIR